MNDTETYRNTLRYALALAGGERELAGYLKVTVGQLESWLNGAEEIPYGIFHSVLDLVLDASPRAVFRSREFLQRIAR
jgi:hypothetical protein